MDLEQALRQLNNEDRAVVWLHDVEGYKHREIARLVGKTESYSKTRLNRARAKLRALIADSETSAAPNAAQTQHQARHQTQERKRRNMTAHKQWNQTVSDPLGLSDLGEIDPGYDGWDQIKSELQAHQASKRNWQKTGAWLAVAASLVLVISLVLQNTEISTPGVSISPEFATSAPNPASMTVKHNVTELIGLSQSMEEQVMKLRQETGSMPAESAIYVAELEDLIAQVDSELSVTPDSIDLWGQRVNLMLDLAQIYQQQWETHYGRMASL